MKKPISLLGFKLLRYCRDFTVLIYSNFFREAELEISQKEKDKEKQKSFRQLYVLNLHKCTAFLLLLILFFFTTTTTTNTSTTTPPTTIIHPQTPTVTPIIIPFLFPVLPVFSGQSWNSTVKLVFPYTACFVHLFSSPDAPVVKVISLNVLLRHAYSISVMFWSLKMLATWTINRPAK